MTRLGRLARTALHAAQHPVNAVGLGSGVIGAVVLDNPLPLALYALSYGVGTVALWNWGVFGDRLDAEDAAAAREASGLRRSSLSAEVSRSVEQLRQYGYQNIRPVLKEYGELSRIRDEVARLAKARGEVNLSSELEIVRRVDEMLEAYLTLASKHLVFLRLLTGIRQGDATSPAPVRALPQLGDRLADLERRRAALLKVIEELPQDSPTREARENQLKALEQRRQVFEEAGRNHESVLSQLDSIRAVFAVIAERMAAADLVAADVSGYLETAATEINHTLGRLDTERLEVDEAA